ncbi:MAG TPA: TetR family transcriptional regulator C-terminal domain-containing protein [Actinoplanes sp.]|nr:TetR family transcriptional regulator C-terminal domain-containing protein [Actinoplanes sp.]
MAAAAGVSAGLVQHYFHTKDEMMSFALAAVSERSEARVRAAVTALGSSPAPRLLLRTVIAALLPLGDAAREEGRVALAFLAYTAVRPSASAELRPSTAQFVDFIATLLPTGDHRAAAGLLALMEGLGVYLLGGQYPPTRPWTPWTPTWTCSSAKTDAPTLVLDAGHPAFHGHSAEHDPVAAAVPALHQAHRLLFFTKRIVAGMTAGAVKG